MLAELVLIGGVAVAVIGVLEASYRSERGVDELHPEAALREAMRGVEGAAVRAEFRRRGVQPPMGRAIAPIGWGA